MKQNRPNRKTTGAFTILEVMVAATILTLGITSCILVLQRGLQALDTARNLTAASQVMQSEMERVRLLNWSQLQELQQSGGATVPIQTGGTPRSFNCQRVIRDMKTDMKQIILTAQWEGYDGSPHSARIITQYGKNGLNDYFYTTP